MINKYSLNDRVSTIDNYLGTIRYIGNLPVWGTNTVALGIEWDDPSRGKNNGDLNGIQYFTPKVTGSGTFIKSSNRFLNHIRKSFVQIIHENYLDTEYKTKNIQFGTKTVEELGWDKLNKFHSNLRNLNSLTLDYCLINIAYHDNEDKQLFNELVNLTNLELSCNLFTDVNEICKIIDNIPSLTSLNINGNRFSKFSQEQRTHNGIVLLKLSSTMMSTLMLEKLIKKFPNLKELYISGNNYCNADIENMNLNMPLTILDLSYNRLEHMPILPLVSALNLSHNYLSLRIIKGTFPNLKSLDLRANQIKDWSEIDKISIHLPDLKELRINHNPLFQELSVDDMTMQLIGRIKCSPEHLWKLNGSFLTNEEIENSELYFISKVEQEKYHIDNEQQWSYLLSKYNKLVESRVSYTYTLKDWMPLTIVLPDSKEISKKFTKNTSILQFKGLLSLWMNDLSILKFSAYYYTNENSTFAEKHELTNYLSTLDSYSLLYDQRIYISIEASI